MVTPSVAGPVCARKAVVCPELSMRYVVCLSHGAVAGADPISTITYCAFEYMVLVPISAGINA